MIDKLEGFAILSAGFGPFYPLVVGGALGVCLAVRPSFRPPPLHWLPLAIPAAVYYAFEFGKSRQHLNMVIVVWVLAICAAAVVVAACVSGRSMVMPIGAAAVTILSVVLWWRVPTAKLRMF